MRKLLKSEKVQYVLLILGTTVFAIVYISIWIFAIYVVMSNVDYTADKTLYADEFIEVNIDE